MLTEFAIRNWPYLGTRNIVTPVYNLGRRERFDVFYMQMCCTGGGGIMAEYNSIHYMNW